MEEINSVKNILNANIKSKYFDSSCIIRDLHFLAKEGDFISILGRSGIGKSTFLRLLSGIDSKYEGQIYFDGNLVEAPSERVLFLFQNNYLLPWLTVQENIKFFVRNIAPAQIDNYLKIVGLQGRNQSYPNELSGGEMRRVGLSVALINECKLLLLDEPFSDLDVASKNSIINLLKIIANKNNTTVIMTTHNIEDAIEISDRIVVLSDNPMKIKYDEYISNDINNNITRQKLLEILLNDSKI